MTDQTNLGDPPPLKDLEDRPSGWIGGSVPVDLARWLRTNPVVAIEAVDIEKGQILFKSKNGGSATTIFADQVDIRPSTTIDGEPTMIALPGWVLAHIDAIIGWERRNPEERQFDVEPISLPLLRECAERLLDFDAGPMRVAMTDRLLAMYANTDEARRMRKRLRTDPNDECGTTAKIVELILAL